MQLNEKSWLHAVSYPTSSIDLAHAHVVCRNRGRDNVEIESLFTMHPGVTSHLVPALITLYKDVEYTERGDQFQSKFQFRKIIAELLEWLLTMPQHHATWAAVGAPTSDTAFIRLHLSIESLQCIVIRCCCARTGGCVCSSGGTGARVVPAVPEQPCERLHLSSGRGYQDAAHYQGEGGCCAGTGRRRHPVHEPPPAHVCTTSGLCISVLSEQFSYYCIILIRLFSASVVTMFSGGAGEHLFPGPPAVPCSTLHLKCTADTAPQPCTGCRFP